MTGVLTRRGKCTQRQWHTRIWGRRPCDAGGRDGGVQLLAQECEGCSQQPEGRRKRPGLPWSLQRENGPVNTLVSDAWPPEL